MPEMKMDLRKVVHPAQGGGIDLRQPRLRPATSGDHPMARQSPAKPVVKKKAGGYSKKGR